MNQERIISQLCLNETIEEKIFNSEDKQIKIDNSENEMNNENVLEENNNLEAKKVDKGDEIIIRVNQEVEQKDISTDEISSEEEKKNEELNKNIPQIQEKESENEKEDVNENLEIKKVEEKENIILENEKEIISEINNKGKIESDSLESKKIENNIINLNLHEISQENRKLIISSNQIVEKEKNKNENKSPNFSEQKIIVTKEENQISNSKTIENTNINIKQRKSIYETNNFEKEKKEEKIKSKPKRLNNSILDIFNKPNKTEEKATIIPKKLGKNRIEMKKAFIENELKPKTIPGKLNKKEIETKIKEEKNHTNKNNKDKEEIIPCNNLKHIINKFNSQKKEEEKTEKEELKLTPGKLNVKSYIEEMNEKNNLKYNNNQNDSKEIKKINMKEKMNQLEESKSLNKVQEDNPENIPQRKYDENYIINLLNAKKEEEEKKVFKKTPPKKINTEEKLIEMLSDQNKKQYDILEEFSFCDLDIQNRDNNKFSETVNLIEKLEEERKHYEAVKNSYKIKRAKRLEEIKKREEMRKQQEEEERKKAKEELIKRREKEEEIRKKNLEEKRIKREKEEAERKRIEEEVKKSIIEANKRLEEELKRIEEEKKKKEEEWRMQQEIFNQKAEERRKIKEEEKKKRLEEEEAERRRLEEEKRIQQEKWNREAEERRKKREEEKRKKEEELKILLEKRKKEDEERRKREEEEEKERRRLEEERREEEEKKMMEEREKERKRKEREQFLKEEALKKMNKKEEDLTPDELNKLFYYILLKIMMEEYESITIQKFDCKKEGKDIKHTFEEIKQISTSPVKNLEITDTGKIVALTGKELSTIIIYKEETYEIEKSEALEIKVNSFKLYGNKIYCSLSKSTDNILIIPLDNFGDKIYLNGHSCEVTDLTLTSSGYLLSADINGNILVWKDNEIKKRINDFRTYINTITEINEAQQRIAILSFGEEKVKLYDLRYTDLQPLATIDNIKGSGFQNNMLKLNDNMLAIAGTYIYIVDINAFMVINTILCFYANDCISTSLTLIGNKGYFFMGQAMTNKWDDEIEKGTLGFYEYEFKNKVIPDNNPLIKLASKNHCHESFISSIRTLDENTFITGSYDGKIKFWKIKDI